MDPIGPEPSGPTVHFDWDEDYGFPDAGIMTVKFRVKCREESIKPNGVKRYHVCLELVEIQKVKAVEAPAPPANSHDDAGKAMDKLKEEAGY